MTERNRSKTGRGKLRVTDPEALLDEINEVARDIYGPTLDRPYHPLVKMGVIAADPSLPPKQAADISNKLAEFFYAKKKAVEVEGDFASDPTIQIVMMGSDGAVRPVRGRESDRVLGYDDEPEAPAMLPATHGEPEADDDG